MGEHGISFAPPKIDVPVLRGWKDKVVSRLVGGLSSMAKQRKVTVVEGTGRFLSPQHLAVKGEAGEQVIEFRQCIIAAGSQSSMIPGLPEDPRIIDSTGALELAELPERMLVIGGGIIGLEMATVYDALGVKVSVVELTDQLMPGVDKDLLRPFEKRIRARYESIMLGTKVTKLSAAEQGITVHFEGKQAPEPQTYGVVLVVVGIWVLF